MKTFSSSKNVHAIPLLLFNGTFVTDFQKKANILIFFFGNECKLVSNKGFLPNETTYVTKERIHSMIQSSTFLIFQISPAAGKFAAECKKVSVVSIHKKNDK